ncbi:MAG TPA: MFS transporter, partial [Tepidisphaeraceae bacterium]|nr:MFS transporter [Tepidisphaeraceae bacterium]
LFVLGVLALMDRLSLPWLFGFSLMNALALTFARPARSSLLPTLIPREDFTNAVTWNSTVFETSSIIGPAIGGIIIAHVPGHVGASLLISAALMLSCAVCTFFLPDRPRTEKPESLSWASLSAGFHFVYRNKLMLAVMSLDLFAVLLAGATYLLPVFAHRLGLDAMGFAALRAAPAVGAISMALIQAHTPPFKRAGRTMLLAVAGFACATIVFGLSESFYLSLAMLFFTGVFDNISVVVRSSIVQMLTPDSMRGRVSAVNFIFVGSSNELGGLESGLTARYFGPVRSVVGGGIAALAVVAAIALRFPQVRRLGRLRDLRSDDQPLALPAEVEARGTDT